MTRHDDSKQMLIGTFVAALLIVPSLAYADPHAPKQPPAPPAPQASVTAPAPVKHGPVTIDAADLKEAAHERREALREAARDRRDAMREAAQEQREAAREAAQAQREAAREAAEAAREVRRAMAKKGWSVRVADASSTGDNRWVKWPVRSYSVSNVHIDGLVGTVTVKVGTTKTVTLDAQGNKSMMDSLEISPRDGTLHIEGSSPNTSVWNWRNWFDFPSRDDRGRATVQVNLTVPKGTPLNIEGLIGDANIGDTMGPLKFEAVASKARIGHVSKANISLAGAGRVDLADVAGPIKLEVAGSGTVVAGSSQGAKVEIAGAGDATLGAIDGDLDLDVAGSGNLIAAKVNGRVSISIAGSGSVKIADGNADPLKVDIMGSGKVRFGGNAVNPNISAMGSGNVWIKSYTGKMSSDGMVNVKVGNE